MKQFIPTSSLLHVTFCVLHSTFLSLLFKRKLRCFLLLTAVAGIPSLHAQQSFEWPEGKRMALSLSFDDARTSHPEVGRDFFREHKAQVTFYVVPSGMAAYISDWKDIVADGHEIGEGGRQTTETEMLKKLIAYANDPSCQGSSLQPWALDTCCRQFLWHQ